MTPVRRVVTGHDANNVAKVLLDGAAANHKTGSSGSTVVHLWNTGATPADIATGESIEDTGAYSHVTPPPPNGSRFVVIDYAPGNRGTMHRTESIDYIVVIAGEIEMVMDDSSVTLRAGDVMVQRGTNHAWFNRGTVPARLAFILVDAQPLGIGHPRL